MTSNIATRLCKIDGLLCKYCLKTPSSKSCTLCNVICYDNCTRAWKRRTMLFRSAPTDRPYPRKDHPSAKGCCPAGESKGKACGPLPRHRGAVHRLSAIRSHIAYICDHSELLGGLCDRLRRRTAVMRQGIAVQFSGDGENGLGDGHRREFFGLAVEEHFVKHPGTL